MNLNNISRTRADRIIAKIRRDPGLTKKQICYDLDLTPHAFQGALPYIKTSCTRFDLEWYLKPIPKEDEECL